MIASQKAIGIFLVGSAHRFYENLQQVAAPDQGIRWIETCFDYQGAEERIRTTQPDVLLLGARLPGAAEYELANRLRARPSPPPLVMGCPAITDEYLVLAVSLGVAACVVMDTPPAYLVQTLRMVGNGQAPSSYNLLDGLDLAPQVRERLRNTPPLATGTPNLNPLSRREREVLQVVSRGYSNRDVGSILSIQEQTVKNHVSSILRKTHARERFQAAARALRNGWIPLR